MKKLIFSFLIMLVVAGIASAQVPHHGQYRGQLCQPRKPAQ
jgi:hypothetical protein